MLARTYKTAAELGITEAQREWLIRFAIDLREGKYPHAADGRKVDMGFDMETWGLDFSYFPIPAKDCGTPRCIGGWMAYDGVIDAERLSKLSDEPLECLFSPYDQVDWSTLTPEQCADAIERWLGGSKTPYEAAA